MLELFEEELDPTTIESNNALTLLKLLPKVFQDEQAFEVLCHLYATFLASRVLALIQFKGYPREMENEVWPIVYTVFSTIWEKGEQQFFKPVAGDSPAVVARKFKVWLRRFAQFICMAEAKRYLEARIHTQPIDDDIEAPDELLDDVIDWLDSKDLLKKILKELEARDQQILTLYICEMKQTEIARTLGISNGAVKAAFYRLEQKCRYILTNMRAQQGKGVLVRDKSGEMHEIIEASSVGLSYTKEISQKSTKEEYHISPPKLQDSSLIPELSLIDYRFSANQSSLLKMRLIEKKDYKDIALIMGKSERAVKAQYHRAYKLLTAAQDQDIFWTDTRLKQLPIKIRETVELRFSKHLAYSVIAEQQNRSESAIRTEISRAKSMVLPGIQEEERRSQPCQPRVMPRRRNLPLENLSRLKQSNYLCFYEALRLAYVEHFSDKEIATYLHRKVGTVKVHLARGAKLLEATLC